jgi:hypothetical protein
MSVHQLAQKIKKELKKKWEKQPQKGLFR